MAEEKTEMKRFYRSKEDRFIGGVCGGLGEYFNTDANLFRILFVVFTFVGGLGLILYIVSLIIVPENPAQEKTVRKTDQDKTLFWALLFIIVGLALLFREFGMFHYFKFWHIPWSTIWAIFLIAIGVFLVISVNRSSKAAEATASEESPPSSFNRITRSTKERMLAGVCGGLAEYFRIDPSIVRIAWVLATLASIGLGILVYILLIFVFPLDTEVEQAIKEK
ncbi:MAG: hypothetical protein Kow0042_08270 [Calditrichia bacterium]